MVTISRIDRADRAHWEPVRSEKGYQLVDQRIPYPDRNWIRSATFAASLDEAAKLVEKGYGIRMGEPGARRGNYIYPKSLKISR